MLIAEFNMGITPVFSTQSASFMVIAVVNFVNTTVFTNRSAYSLVNIGSTHVLNNLAAYVANSYNPWHANVPVT